MKKRVLALICSGVVMASAITGCSSSETATQEDNQSTSQESAEETVEESDLAEKDSEEAEPSEETESEDTDGSQEDEAETEDTAESDASYEVVRVGSLKGPTTMGLVNLMQDSENGEAIGTYEFTMATQPDEIMASFVSGDIDIALVPANVAAVMYNKTEGGVRLVDINTLGVLYCVTGDESIKSVADLAGKTVLTTGQGATPEYAMNYLLEKNGVTDCSLEFKSEATEIAAVLQEDPTQIAILPQPFVTVAEMQNEELKTAFGLTDEWEKVSEDSQLITGVTVVRAEYLEEHKAEVENFVKEHAKSAETAVSEVEATSELVAKYGIIEKAPVAAKAIPECNIVCISGDDAKTALSGYLQTLFDADPKAVGGNLPAEDFYIW